MQISKLIEGEAMSIDSIGSSILNSATALMNSSDVQIEASTETAATNAIERPESDRPSIFNRAWSSVNVKSILTGLIYISIAAGFAALWIFLPAVALPVTIAALSAIASKIGSRVADVLP